MGLLFKHVFIEMKQLQPFVKTAFCKATYCTEFHLFKTLMWYWCSFAFRPTSESIDSVYDFRENLCYKCLRQTGLYKLQFENVLFRSLVATFRNVNPLDPLASYSLPAMQVSWFLRRCSKSPCRHDNTRLQMLVTTGAYAQFFSKTPCPTCT